ncbi:MAG: two-component system phosphate regulon response regulator PhoB [Bradymonadia bacterium]|jgi:two-component system phosphate regulon response regulator PhoB
MSKPHKILIVEDEVDLLELIDFNLRQAGYETLLVSTGAEALAVARAERPDCILLDLMLPDIQGSDVCRVLRADPATAGAPIIMVTAKGEEIDRVVGFELGADDYVVKPFSPRELVLRVRAILRRSPATERNSDEPSETLEIGDIVLDIGAHEARVAGSPIELTALEFRLLQTLASRAGRVQSRDRLLDDVWGDVSVTQRTVDTHVKRLRDKLGSSSFHVQTVRGVGYRFVKGQ